MQISNKEILILALKNTNTQPEVSFHGFLILLGLVQKKVKTFRDMKFVHSSQNVFSTQNIRDYSVVLLVTPNPMLRLLWKSSIIMFQIICILMCSNRFNEFDKPWKYDMK